MSTAPNSTFHPRGYLWAEDKSFITLIKDPEHEMRRKLEWLSIQEHEALLESQAQYIERLEAALMKCNDAARHGSMLAVQMHAREALATKPQAKEEP